MAVMQVIILDVCFAGLLHPRASSSAVPVAAIPPTLRQAGGNSMSTSNTRRVEVRRRRSESVGRAENDRQTIDRTGTLYSPPKPLLVQSQEFHNYNSQSVYQQQQRLAQNNIAASHHPVARSERKFPNPSSQPKHHVMSNGLEMNTLTLNNNNTMTRAGSHLVNGKLYAAKAGYIINSNGQVVNLTDGEVMSLVQAERSGIVYKMTDKDHQSGQSYVPASNMMFNRVRH